MARGYAKEGIGQLGLGMEREKRAKRDPMGTELGSAEKTIKKPAK